MRAILTVVGKDKVGIIAEVSKQLGELNINILDVSQTIMDGYFTMMMMLDITKIQGDFFEGQERLKKLGEKLDVTINIQREEIFNTMHKL